MQVDRLRAGGANSIIDEFINYYEDRGALEKDEIGWTDLHWLRCMPPRHAPMRRAPRAQRPPRVPCPAQGAARRACRYVGGVVAEKRFTHPFSMVPIGVAITGCAIHFRTPCTVSAPYL